MDRTQGGAADLAARALEDGLDGLAVAANKGRERVQANLTQGEQTEFWNLLKKSKGRPASLSQRDRTRLKNIVGKAIRG